MQSNHSKIEKQAFPFYPLLFGIYPVLALAAYNITQIDLSSASCAWSCATGRALLSCPFYC